MNKCEVESLKEEQWVGLELSPDENNRMGEALTVVPPPWFGIYGKGFGKDCILLRSGKTFEENELRETLNQFVDKPVIKALCPVCRMWIVINKDTRSVDYKGTQYYFCRPQEHSGVREDRLFKKDPERYLSRRSQL